MARQREKLKTFNLKQIVTRPVCLRASTTDVGVQKTDSVRDIQKCSKVWEDILAGPI